MLSDVEPGGVKMTRHRRETASEEEGKKKGGEEGEGRESTCKRSKMCYAYAPTLHKDCNTRVLRHQPNIKTQKIKKQ